MFLQIHGLIMVRPIQEDVECVGLLKDFVMNSGSTQTNIAVSVKAPVLQAHQSWVAPAVQVVAELQNEIARATASGADGIVLE